MSGLQKEALKLIVVLLAIAGIVVGVLRGFFVTPVRITNNGMAPTLLSGEHAYMWRDGTPSVGSIAVCRSPQTGETVIGRVVVVGAGTLQLGPRGMNRSGHLEARDVLAQESFFNSDINREEQLRRISVSYAENDHEVFEPESGLREMRELEVPGARLFLLGDHRGDARHDSRSFGHVVAADCLGTLFMRGENTGELDHGFLDLL